MTVIQHQGPTMTSTQNVFSCDSGTPPFEEMGVKNGITHWSEAIVCEALGYETEDGFRGLLNRAMQACLTLNIATEDHFSRQSDGRYVFTRFACYLLAMNGDPKKPEVAAAQVWFAKLADTFAQALEHVEALDRTLTRDKVAQGEKSLSSTASRHGVESYGLFQNAGYRGMYNMNLNQILAKKGIIGGDKLIDRMGSTELAAHLFRITQTDERVKKLGATGQRNLELIASEVGKKVRAAMDTPPEQLPPAEHIRHVKKKLKGTDKALRKLDAGPKRKRSN